MVRKDDRTKTVTIWYNYECRSEVRAIPKQTSLWLTDELIQRIAAAAKAKGVTKTGYIRMSILAMLTKDKR